MVATTKDHTASGVPRQKCTEEPEAFAEAGVRRKAAVRLVKQRLTWCPSVASLCSAASSPDAIAQREAVADPPDQHALPLLPGNEDNYRQLLEILSVPLSGRGSSSVFLMGPRGLGKSMVVYKSLASLIRANRGSGNANSLLPIHVSAQFVSDDDQAVSEVCSKLWARIEESFGNMEGARHLAGCRDIRVLLEFLCPGRTPGGGCARPTTVVLVVDDFDLLTSRPRQAFLYSVLDSLQSPLVSLAVVCLTSRHDVEQLLEKRVRSRFSGRRLLFAPPSGHELAGLARQLLTLPVSACHCSGSREAGLQGLSPEQGAGSCRGCCSAPSWATVAEAFNESVRLLFPLGEPLPGVLESSLLSNPSPPCLQRLLFRAVCAMASRGGTRLLMQDLEAAAAAAPESRCLRMQALEGLSVLDMWLLVAVVRLEKRQHKAYNFTMVFTEYESFDSKRGSDIYPMEVCRQAFQRLLEQGFLVSVPRSTGPARKDMFDFAPVQCSVFPLEVEAAVERHGQCPAKMRKLLAQEMDPGLSSATMW